MSSAWLSYLSFSAINIAFYQETRLGLTNLRSLAALRDVYTTSEYLGYLWSTLVLATWVTLLSLVYGVAMALLVARTNIGGKGMLDFMIIMPLFLSPFAGMMAWVALGSEKSGLVNGAIQSLFGDIGLHVGPVINIWSYGGIVWVMFLFFCPFAYLFTIGGLTSMDASLEEAARMSRATPFQTLMKITLPMSAPAILASGLLIFVLAAELYTIPGMIGSIIGYTTLPWKIYQDSTAFPVHTAHAAAGGTLLLWVTVLGVWLQRRMTRQGQRFVTVSGKGFRAKPMDLGYWKLAAYAIIGFYIMCADILPFGGLLLSSFMKYSAPSITADVLTLKNYSDLINLPGIGTALWNTIWLAVLSGMACVAIGLVISFGELRRPGVMTAWLAFISVLPVAVPGIVYGVGLQWVFLRTPFYGTTLVLLLAYVAKFLPFAVVVSRSAVLQIHPELEQSARMSGASGLVALRAITMPLLKPTLIGILFFVMLMSIKELSASVLLYTQRSQVLSVLTWNYMDAGNYQFAAAIGVIQTIMMILLVVLTRAVFRIKLENAIVRS